MLMITHSKAFWFSIVLMRTIIFGIPLNKNEECDTSIDKKSMEFLLDKGCLKKTESTISQLQMEKDISKAIIKLQKFANIPITGQLNAETKEYISKPRCGMPDITNNSIRKRKRKNVTGGRWKKLKLTWFLVNDNNDGISRDEVREIIHKSFEKWSSVTNLEFIELVNGPYNSSDIRISFEKGKHNDPYPFNKNEFGHVYDPSSNLPPSCHFNDNMVFANVNDKDDSKVGLFFVTLHELGHAIGVKHLYTRGAVMYPFSESQKGDDFNLTEEDIKSVQDMYGSRVLPAITTSMPIVTLSPKADCPSTVGAIVRINDGKTTSTLVFNKDKFHILNRYDFGVEKGPFLVSSKFYPLTFVDAIFTRDNYHFFFHGDTFSVFMDYKLQRGTRKISDGFQKLDAGFRDVDAALSIDGSVFLFKGEYYWKFNLISTKDYTLDDDYPKKITTYWIGLPSSIDAAFTWINGEIYFFKGTEYYRVNKKYFKVEYGYPVKLSESFLKCNLQEGLNNQSSKESLSLPNSFVLLLSVFLTFLSQK